MISRPFLRCWLSLLVVVALAAPTDDAAARKKKRQPEARTVEDLQVVDCLLPGQLRQLGNRATYVTARRPIRTTALDCRIRGGEYVAGDRSSYAGSLAAWLPAAEAGDPEAQTYVGEIFEKGQAGLPDHASAAVWYRKAADQGSSRAQIDLAHLYEKGLGVPQDQALALQWYRRSAGISEAVALDWEEQETELRGELASVREELEAVRGELDAARAELGAAEAEVEDLRRQLEKARTQADTAESERITAQLHQREAEVARIRATVGEYRQRMARLQAIETGEVAGPTITIVQPEVLATRGPVLVPVPSGVTEMEITGRVNAPAGLAALTAGDLVPSTDDDGFFRVTVPCATRTEVALEASDRHGRRAQARLILEPGARSPSTGTAGPSPAVRGPRRTSGSSPHRHALVISVAGYEHLPPLKTSAADGREVARVLAEKYGYRTTLLEDPNHFEILRALNSLREELGEDDYLLIYYAGHGKVAEGKGYWIGVDGDSDDTARWIPNEAISDLIDVVAARHVMVVSDSCYSGTLTRSGVARIGADLAPGERAERLREVGGKKSRTVLTSGGLQPVLDEGAGGHSLFAGAFLRVLELNVDPLAGADLHREVAARVRFRALSLGIRQKPDYAPIRHAGHEAGDFVLVPAG